MSKTTTYGRCFGCGQRVAKSVMTRHIKKCLPTVEEDPESQTEMMLLRVDAAYSKLYWLYLGVEPDVALYDIDYALRQIWLECCDHSSAFFSCSMRCEPDMDMTCAQAFAFDAKPLEYIYDFGSSTRLKITAAGSSPARTSLSVWRLAQNEDPVWRCALCEEPASQIVSEAACGSNSLLCDTHAEPRIAQGDMLLPVVNSPRMGVCGFGGTGVS